MTQKTGGAPAQPGRPTTQPVATIAPGADISLVVEKLINDAFKIRTSDIHIEPQAKEVNVRYRVDGKLRTVMRYPLDFHQQLVSRVKILASLDISERRKPQDGRIAMMHEGKPRDLRVATSPMVEGEKIVLRCIYTDMSKLKLEDAGYSERNIAIYKGLVSMPHGLVIHCGPTGSGKTTSLYTALNYLNSEERNIQTIEDPVEVRMPGLNQAQVNHEAGVTFATLLRSYLRQDCNVMLVGEIRDAETANLAVQAALTGHLILGTLHSNTAVGAISRLTEIGVARFFVGTALAGVCSQRLVRRLCQKCKQAYVPPEKVAKALELTPGTQIFKAVGCADCNQAGYKGRCVIHEVLKVDEKVREAIYAGTADMEVERIAVEAGMATIFQDGLLKAREGVTSVEEVARCAKGVNLGK